MNQEKPTKRTLALDLGPSSIGWALVDEARQQIVAIGTRVFPEGVADYGTGKEAPKNQTRRTKRGMRRQVQRRARRKRNLRHALVHAGFFPPEAALPANDPARIAWETDNFAASVYELRARALHEKLSPLELGRVFLHLAQRRGFQSNRKTDKAKQKEDSETLKEISDLQAAIEAAGKGTLGEYLAARQNDNQHVRIRKRHTRRDMLVKEFDAIWDAQAKHHPDLLTDALKTGERGKADFPFDSTQSGGKPAELLRRFGIRGMIFFQRKMYWPKSAIGRCELDPSQERCLRADRAAQEFRLLQELNNLRLVMPDGEIRPLDDKYSTALTFLQTKESVKFEELAKKLRLQPNTGFNLQAGERKSLDGMATDAVLRRDGKYKTFGSKAWDGFSDDKKNAIVRAILETDEAKGRAALAEPSLEIDPALIDTVLAVHLPEGRSNYGLATIEKLLPFLRQRLPLSTAKGPCAIHAAGYKLPWEREVDATGVLPMPPKITNPLVRQAIFEVRKVVNAIVKEYGKPDTIHVELAREVKGNSIQRARQSKDMRAREDLRDVAADEIRAGGQKVSRDAIERVLLWKEQRKECIYTGKSISLAQLLGGEVDVDHLLPYSQSLDDSLMNKVVCFRSENAAKGQRTVYQWLAGINPKKYDEIRQRAAKLPIDIRNRKFPRFQQADCQLDDFIARQLTDTAYITRTVVAYLKHVCADVVGTKGQLTARLRHDWGLDTILNPEKKPEKSREDHRHHAVDAIVIALTNQARLQQLARTQRHAAEREVMPEPWPGFHTHVAEKIDAILVSHRVPRGIYGPLHEEFLYGATQQVQGGTKLNRPWAKNWTEEKELYVRRKFLRDLSLSEVEHIRDDRIRELVLQRLKEFNCIAGRKKRGTGNDEDSGSSRKIPQEAWSEPLLLYPRKGQKTGVPTVINKVRITIRDRTAVPLSVGTNTHVIPASVHHVEFFRRTDGAGKETREAHFVSMLEAAGLRRHGNPSVQKIHPEHPDAEFLFSLHPGEMLEGTFNDQKILVVFTTGASTSKQMWFAEHTDARPSTVTRKRRGFSKKPNTLDASKVSIDILGRLKPADA